MTNRTPRRAIVAASLLTLLANAVPIVAIPLVGLALQDGRGEAAFIALAAVVAVAGVLNVRPPTRRVQPV